MEQEILENNLNNIDTSSLEEKPIKKSNTFMSKVKKYTKYNWQIFVLFLPAFLWMIFFVFVPFISNVLMSFQDYSVSKGIFGSKFIGFKNYVTFFSMDGFFSLLGNTLLLNLLVLVIGFPAAILLAIMIYESKSKVIKGVAQTTTFLPFFISAVVVCNMTIEFLKADTGMIINILSWFGVKKQNLLENPHAFRWIYAIMELWQTIGYNSLIYLAALSAIDTSLYEAASMDGAGSLDKSSM